MINRIDKIYNYISYLIKTYNLQISLHPMYREKLICESRLLDFNVHRNNYCNYIKVNELAFKNCLSHQKDVIACHGEESFIYTCYAGVTEYVYPFKGKDKIMGYICVGNYQTEKPDKFIKKISGDYLLNYDTLNNFYNRLSQEIPDKEKIDVLIYPLCDMLELAYNFIDDTQEQNVSLKILNYIDLNYRRKLTIEELSQKFYISYSSISHKFKQYTGMSINDYINNLRIEDAKNLIKYTKLTITEIADVVGFSGVNYFINVFTKHEGISPGKFRKNISEE